MLQELTITPSTIVIVALVLVGAFFAVRRIVRRGLCDCGDGCDSCDACSHKKGSRSCKTCAAADEMVKNIDKAVGDSTESAACCCGKKQT